MLSAVRWYRSLYVRVVGSIVLFSVCLLIVQALLFTLRQTRSPLGDRPPNTVVAMVAADLESVLAADSGADLDAYLAREYGQSQPIYVVSKNGHVASNRDVPLASDMQAYVEGLLQGAPRPTNVEPNVPIPFVTAPVQVSGALTGVVVLPPRPSPNPFARELGRLATVPGIVLLGVLAVVAAAFIFEPARRRLRALENSARRLGSGDLTARAEVTGGDEVAALGLAFNRMADDLAARTKALETSNRLRRQMLADVSHELKTPLTSMRSYVETLRDDAIRLDGATRERHFDILERETLRLDRLVKELVDLSRLENGVIELHTRVFATRRLFEHVRDRHLPEIAARRIDVRLDIDDSADQMCGDPDRLEQVIENLFGNALRHTPNAGCIMLSARSSEETMRLSVSDSGVGIAPEHLPHVFERFYKVDAARTHVSEGSGLGLSIAKAIVERHGGTISVSSMPSLTVFSIQLPQSSGGDREQSHSASTNL